MDMFEKSFLMDLKKNSPVKRLCFDTNELKGTFKSLFVFMIMIF